MCLLLIWSPDIVISWFLLLWLLTLVGKQRRCVILSHQCVPGKIPWPWKLVFMLTDSAIYL